MANKTNSNKGGQGVAIEELLAAPFIAAASANSAMARKQTSFLMDTCFDHKKNDDEDDLYLPKMISLSITKNYLLPSKNKEDPPRMEKITSKFQIPLLTLVPFNSLCVKDVTVKFDLEIVSQETNKSTSQSSSEGTKETQMKGTISYDSKEVKDSQYQRRNSSKLSVEMIGGSIPLPIGLTTLLELYTKNINSSELKGRSKELED